MPCILANNHAINLKSTIKEAPVTTCSPEWWVCQRRNQETNESIPVTKWKWMTTQQNLWDTLRVLLIGKFIVLSAYIKKS